MRRVAALIGSLFTLAAAPALAFTPTPPRNGEELFGAAFATPDLARFSRPGGAFVDSLFLARAGYDLFPTTVLLQPQFASPSGAERIGMAIFRNWPAAISVEAGRLTVDVTPHAGFAVGAGGGQLAEAGALLRLQQTMLRAVGMAGAGERSHLYLFAGASGRAIGLNLLRHQAGVGADREDGFVRQAEAGLGFQRGFVQAALGVSQQRTTLRAIGEAARIDNRVGLTLSIR